MPGKQYEVPVISADLRKEESIIQLLDNLQHLSNVVDGVFTGISAKVEQNRQRLVSVNNRLNVARAKVQKIQGTKAATQVFSSAKYPAPETMTPFIPLGTSLPDISKPHGYRPIEGRIGAVDPQSLKDKKQFLNIELKSRRKKDQQITEDEENHEGLGGLPRNLSSLSGLLLFNTATNPYKKYVTIDPLKGAVTKTRADVDEDVKMAEAPSSILLGDQYVAQAGDDYNYKPDIGQVPTIETPAFLPDLFGVADLSFSADLGPTSIAPSAAVPDLPDLAGPSLDDAPPSLDAAAPTSVLGTPDDAAAPPPPPPDAPAPPPPPAPSAAPPPPAPAPPPPSMDAAPPPPAAAPDAPPPAAVPEPDDDDDDDSGRGGLLAAIRKGKKLKSSKEKRKQAKKEAAISNSGSSGSIMDALAARLKMRREGISGTQKEKEKSKSAPKSDDEDDDAPAPPRLSKSSGSMMDKLSEMIPHHGDDGDASEEEWDSDS